jgi:hypothetical protein
LREQQQLLQNCVMLSLKRIQKYVIFDINQGLGRKKSKKMCLPQLRGDKNGAFEIGNEFMVLIFNAYFVDAGGFAPMKFCAGSRELVVELHFGEVGNLGIDADTLITVGVGCEGECGVG